MLNLLFISDSSKAEYIKSALQPVLKVIIDVVTDFDHGLKDVFEKRPTTVCIQDQIGGVTGESVARHIQMLLGSSAPNFILLHNASAKARTINGLFEYMVDLSQPEAVLADSILNTLKSLLGDQWDKVYVAPKAQPVAVAEEHRIDAEKLVDDFLSDLETSGFSILDEHPPSLAAAHVPPAGKSVVPDQQPVAETPVVKTPPPPVEALPVQSTSDEMAQLLLAEVGKAAKEEARSDTTFVKPEPEVVFRVAEKPVVAPESPAPVAPPPVASPRPEPPTRPVVTVTPKAERPKPAPSASTAPAAQKSPSSTGKPETVTAAEFKISHKATLDEEPIPDDLLQAFEANYRSESRSFRTKLLIALLCLATVAGGWYVYNQNLSLFAPLKKQLEALRGNKTAPPVPPTAVATPQPATVAAPALPSFVPKEGVDKLYAEKNPGWERYQGSHAEFRLFRSGGRLQAVQVLAKDVPLPESLIKTVTQELCGSQLFTITGQSNKAGVRIESGTVAAKGDIKIYRKNGSVKGFVLSIN